MSWLRWKIRELLNEYEFPGDDTPIIQGSALKALEDPNGPSGATRSWSLWMLLIPGSRIRSVRLISRS